MLLDRQPVDAIAQALRTERTEIAWRTKRIVGRLRPKLRRLKPRRSSSPARRAG
jgi:hypothetical protein